MTGKIGVLVLAAIAVSFADEGTYIRNICDSLPFKDPSKVELRLSKLEAISWSGSKDLAHKDSGKVMDYSDDYTKLNPLRDQFKKNLPLSITAGCSETKNNLFKFANWDSRSKTWIENDENNDYATCIMDVNIYEFPDFNASNSYNVLALRKGSLPEEDSYTSDELMVSRTFEFNFEWWYSIAMYTELDTIKGTDGGISISVRNHYATSLALDSASALNRSIDSLNVPDSIAKVQYQLIHAVLSDANKIQSSSSAQPTSSASEDCDDDPRLSCGYESNKSSSSMGSSSSEEEETTLAGGLLKSLRESADVREIRRLDGSRVSSSETLNPGVYYVKGVDGRWKKRIEFPR